MIGKAPFFEDAVLKLFLFVGREASGKLNHQYCDSTLFFLYSFVLQAAGANFVYCRSHAAAKFGRGNVYSSANSLKSFRSSPCALEIILSVVSSVVLPFLSTVRSPPFQRGDLSHCPQYAWPFLSTGGGAAGQLDNSCR